MNGTELLSVDPPGRPLATLILAHGAGAPMDSPFMALLCDALAAQAIATVRFEFPYMARRRREGGRRPPDRTPVLLEAWRQVFQQVCRNDPRGKLLIGGKSLGGRMASLVAEELAPDGFCCLGFPFQPPGKAPVTRTSHFSAITVPGLILQGTRDSFGKPGEIDTSAWPEGIRLVWLDEGDHDFRTRKSSGLCQGDLIERAAHRLADWVRQLPAGDLRT